MQQESLILTAQLSRTFAVFAVNISCYGYRTVYYVNSSVHSSTHNRYPQSQRRLRLLSSFLCYLPRNYPPYWLANSNNFATKSLFQTCSKRSSGTYRCSLRFIWRAWRRSRSSSNFTVYRSVDTSFMKFFHSRPDLPLVFLQVELIRGAIWGEFVYTLFL